VEERVFYTTIFQPISGM